MLNDKWIKHLSRIIVICATFALVIRVLNLTEEERNMVPIWFLVFLAICACFAFGTVVRGIKGDGLYIGGERISRLTIILAAIGIMIAFGFFAATQLGFIADHAP